MKLWRNAANNAELSSINIEKQQNSSVIITAKLNYPTVDSKVDLAYTVWGDGTIKVNCTFHHSSKMPTAPRLGMTTAIPLSFTKYEWYGRGPHEAYADRKESAAVGIYTSGLKEMWFDYVLPQENGNRTDVRNFSAISTDGIKLTVTGAQTFDFSVWPYTIRNVSDAKRIYELTPADSLTLRIDYGQIGVGGDTSWGEKAMPHKPFIFTPGKTYNYAFTIGIRKI
jgi:beta-galactosidase